MSEEFLGSGKIGACSGSVKLVPSQGLSVCVYWSV